MIIHDCEQLSPEWHLLHDGIPTATDADKILTPAGKLSAQSEGLINSILAERAGFGDPPFDPTEHMIRGIELEDEAMDNFTFETGLKVAKVGFVTNDDGSAGCSPDGIIYDGDTPVAGYESKAPKASTQFGYLRAGVVPKTYIPQIHWSMVITELSVWHFQSYYPGLDPLILKVERDSYTDKVELAMNEFLARLAEESGRFKLERVA